jgi:hypothetical protein
MTTDLKLIVHQDLERSAAEQPLLVLGLTCEMWPFLRGKRRWV